MEKLVCPDCGNTEFIQRHYPALDTTVEVYPDWLDDISDEIMDDERDGALTCTDCGFEASHNDELIPESEYTDAD